VDVLAAQAPELAEALDRVHEEGWAFVILDGTIIDTDRVAGTTTSRKGQTIDLSYSGKTHDVGGNIHAVMRPDGLPIRVSTVEPGNTHDLVAAHRHALGTLYAARACPPLADPGYAGAGIGVHTPFKQPADGRRLGIDNRNYNKLLRSLRCPGERGFALLVGRWRVLQHVTTSPNRISDLANAALVLTQFEHRYLPC
jgi:DDE superfamily endonuclease